MALTAMNPETRKVIPVTLKDGEEEEINNLMEALLGDDIETRRNMLENYMEETSYEGRISM